MMININYKRMIFYLSLTFLIFLLDRFSKIYILELAQINNSVDIYLTSFLNLYLIWNKGIAFGLFSFDQDLVYNCISILIAVIIVIILIMIFQSNDFRGFFLVFILGGALGNLFDRVYYSAVPDFIDFHINNFHWFIFNVADIFISIGVICLIFAEIVLNKRVNNEKI